MVKGGMDNAWHQKIMQYKKNQKSSETSALLLDILMGLCQDLSEVTKIELLSLLQEHGEALIQNQEDAEQAAGSLKNILENIHDKNGKLYIANCLITATTIIIEFDLKDFNRQLVHDMVGILVSMIKRVNAAGQAFLRKVACECLLELETSMPLMLERYLNVIYELTRTEKSHAAQSYMVLFSTTLLNSLLGHGNDNTESEHRDHKTESVDEASDMPISLIIAEKGQHMASFISEEYNLLTPAAKWHVGKEICHIFAGMDMTINVLISKLLLECSLSMDLHMLHLGVYLILYNVETSKSICDIEMFVASLLRDITIPQFPTRFKFMCLRWFSELLSSLRMVINLENTFDLTNNVLENIMPTVFDVPDLVREKLQVINEVTVMHPNQNSNAMQYFQVPLKLAQYGVATFRLAVLYRALYLQFVSAQNNETREEISDQIFQITMKNPTFIAFTVDFISVVRDNLLEPVCCHLIGRIVDYILRLDYDNFMGQSDYYFLLLEHACSEKDLWPMAIVKWLKKICTEFQICRFGSWKTGSNILLICRGILRVHTAVSLLHELADFLWLLHQRFNDDDIKDRALFYYLTIGHASPQHYCKIFASTEAEHRIQAISKKTDIEIPSNVMQGVLPTVRMDKEFLSLGKSSVHKDKRLLHLPDNIYKDVSRYREMLQDEMFDRNVYLDLQVQHCKETPGNVAARVFALTLKFNTYGPYKVIPDIHLPYLSKFVKSDFSSRGESILLKFEPEQPMPFQISVTAVFSNDAGRTCIVPIKPIQLEFSDFFNPLIGADQPGEFDRKRELFNSLWVQCGENQRKTTAEELSCAESVKRLIISRQDIKSSLLHDLEPFVVSSDADHVTKVGIFLPPCYCALLVFEIGDEETVVRLRVDNWELLSLVEDYLELASKTPTR